MLRTGDDAAWLGPASSHNEQCVPDAVRFWISRFCQFRQPKNHRISGANQIMILPGERVNSHQMPADAREFVFQRERTRNAINACEQKIQSDHLNNHHQGRLGQ